MHQREFSRRTLLLGGGAAAVNVALGGHARASQVCNAVRCDARISTTSFPHIGQPLNSLWCWAATISMISQWHGRQINLRSIVQQTFGTVVDAPADPMTLIKSLNKPYVDDVGQPFYISSSVWSVLHGVANVDNAMIISELSANRPLVVCNASHMMALVGVSFPPGSNNIDQAWVADPAVNGVVTAGMPGLAPLAAGFRYLFPQELVPAPWGGQLVFVATVNVY